ncbi:MAG: FAD-binding protein [Dermatophilaceae bacterium]
MSATPSPTSTTTDVEIRPSLEQELRRRVNGEVRFDVGSQAAYAVDSSNYRQVPLAGQTTNRAVVIDWPKYCHHLVSVDAAARSCVVEPGIALDELNRELADHDLMFGPKPSTHRSCTLGGMIGNNSCGSTALAYGKTADNLTRLEVLTYDGFRMWVGPLAGGENASTALAARAYRLLSAKRRAVLDAAVTIDMDSTDVQVHGPKKQGVAYTYARQRCGRPPPGQLGRSGPEHGGGAAGR